MKRIPEKDNSNNAQQHQLSGFLLIHAYIQAAQNRFASYLQMKTNDLTNSRKKMLLLLFTLLFGGSSIAVMCYSFMTVNVPVQSSAITFPKYSPVNKPKFHLQDSLITHSEYDRIGQFKHYLEQLQEDAACKKIYDSLVQARPYLLDSIHKVDSIYLNK
jgi:hypothetical protein